MLRLDPPIPVRTPLGDGHAYFVTDYGRGNHLQWTVAIDATQEFWTFANPQIRRQTSITDNWLKVSDWRPEDREMFPWSPEFED